ncbi:MAG: EamA family transporter [Chloroflexota bacterium]
MTDGRGRPAAGDPVAVRVTDHVPAWTLAVAAMLAWHVGSAISVGLFAAVGSAGTSWLRLSIGALVLLAIYRPNVRGMGRSRLGPAVVMGATIGTMTLTFLASAERIPFGTAVALGFMGPLTLGVLGTRSLRDLVWPVLAIFGVLALTEPWAASADVVGVAFGLANGVCWALYIVLSAHVGGKFSGAQGLSVVLPVAAVVAGIVGIPQAAGHLTWEVLATATVAAVLVVVVSFSLDMLALRRIATSTFGTIAALQPATGALIGFLSLGQVPTAIGIVGTVLVVIAGIGVTRAEAARHALPSPQVQTGLMG